MEPSHWYNHPEEEFEPPTKFPVDEFHHGGGNPQYYANPRPEQQGYPPVVESQRSRGGVASEEYLPPPSSVATPQPCWPWHSKEPVTSWMGAVPDGYHPPRPEPNNGNGYGSPPYSTTSQHPHGGTSSAGGLPYGDRGMRMGGTNGTVSPQFTFTPQQSQPLMHQNRPHGGPRPDSWEQRPTEPPPDHRGRGEFQRGEQSGFAKPRHPDVRVQFGSSKLRVFNKPIRPEDIVVIPFLFGDEENVTYYIDLMREIRDILSQEGRSLDTELARPGNQFVVVKRSRQSDTCNKVVDRLCEYFKVSRANIGCSLAVRKGERCELSKNDLINMERNVTISACFGSTRDCSFQCSLPLDPNPHNAVQMDIPQPNNTVFCVGRGVNMRWKIGINSLDPEADGKAVTVSIILRGVSAAVVAPPPRNGHNATAAQLFNGAPAAAVPSAHEKARARPRGAPHLIDASPLAPHPAKRGRY